MKSFKSPLTPISKFGSLILLYSILFLNGCTKNPCDDFPSFSASFAITEVPVNPIFWDKEPYDTDSVSSVEVKFIANEPNARAYEWKIGSDPRTFTGKELQLRFQNTFNKEFDVTLTVIKANPCSPTDTVKTLTRTFYKRASQVSGRYQGYFNHSNKRAELKLEADYIHPYYYTWQYPNYATYFAGVLLTGIPDYDTLFISRDGSELLNQRVYVNENMDNYIINKTITFPKGEIIFDVKTNKVKINLNVKEVSSQSTKSLLFEGTKM